jgi:hypothetical protein
MVRVGSVVGMIYDSVEQSLFVGPGSAFGLKRTQVEVISVGGDQVAWIIVAGGGPDCQIQGRWGEYFSFTAIKGLGLNNFPICRQISWIF